MKRASLAAAFICLSGPAMALCAGDSFLTQISAETRDKVFATASSQPYAEGNLWELTRDDTTLTVVGTMHVYDDRLLPLRERVQPALAEADLLLVEATAEEEQAMQAALAAQPELYLITEGPTLPDLLSPDDWANVQQAASDRGIPGFLVAKMQPWYLSLTLSIPACAMADLIAGKPGLDKMLMADAETLDVPLQPLEGWETLISALADSPFEEQLAALEVSLLPKEDQQSVYVALLDTYFAEQTAAVWTLGEIAARELTDLTAEEVSAQMAETQEVLLDQRNLNWIPVIEEAAATHDSIVVAAGAAHLPGELGILNLLADEGWQVTRLRD